VRIVALVGLLVAAVIVYGVVDNQPPIDIVAGALGVVVLASVVVLMPLLARACEAEGRFWAGVGRRIRRFANGNAKPS
jgi:hypothetical protein